MEPTENISGTGRETEPPPLSLAAALRVWGALLLLTGITVAVARLHLGKWSILSALAIASIKAGLVISFFMGLRREAPIFWWMLLAAIVTLATIIGLTFIDVLLR